MKDSVVGDALNILKSVGRYDSLEAIGIVSLLAHAGVLRTDWEEEADCPCGNEHNLVGAFENEGDGAISLRLGKGLEAVVTLTKWDLEVLKFFILDKETKDE